MAEYIVTIGSCLSVNIAMDISSRTKYKRISSVQHYRMDVYTDTYLLSKYKVLHKSDCNFVYKSQYKNTNLIENQQDDVGFGCSLPYGERLIHNRKAIESGNISLLIIDNFADIYFKVYYNKKNNYKLFLNREYFSSGLEGFTIEKEYEDINKYIESLEIFIRNFREFNPLSEIVFINFPVNLNNNELVRKRAIEMADAVDELADKMKFKIIDPIGIYERDLLNKNDIHHFSKRKYTQIAHMVLGELKI